MSTPEETVTRMTMIAHDLLDVAPSLGARRGAGRVESLSALLIAHTFYTATLAHDAACVGDEKVNIDAVIADSRELFGRLAVAAAEFFQERFGHGDAAFDKPPAMLREAQEKMRNQGK